MKSNFCLFPILLLLALGCQKAEKEVTIKGGEKMLKLTSTAFENGGRIPTKYTADGDDISPPLKIENVPANAKSLVLIVDDPDAPMGTWDHWIIWNIPPTSNFIPEGKTPQGVLGTNDFGKLEYGGPAPPSGTHRYKFKLYALDTELNLKQGSRKKEVERAMKGHVIEEVVLEGKYSR